MMWTPDEARASLRRGFADLSDDQRGAAQSALQQWLESLEHPHRLSERWLHQLAELGAAPTNPFQDLLDASMTRIEGNLLTRDWRARLLAGTGPASQWPWSVLDHGADGGLDALQSHRTEVLAAWSAGTLGHRDEESLREAVLRPGSAWRMAYVEQVRAAATEVVVPRLNTWTLDVVDTFIPAAARPCLVVPLPHASDALRVYQHVNGTVWCTAQSQRHVDAADGSHVWGDTVIGQVETAIHHRDTTLLEQVTAGAETAMSLGQVPDHADRATALVDALKSVITPRLEAARELFLRRWGPVRDAAQLQASSLELALPDHSVEHVLVDKQVEDLLHTSEAALTPELASAWVRAAVQLRAGLAAYAIDHETHELLCGLLDADEALEPHAAAVLWIGRDEARELGAAPPLADPCAWWGLHEHVDALIPREALIRALEALPPTLEAP